jgi:hypothetical protein
MVRHAVSVLRDIVSTEDLAADVIATARTETPMGVFIITGRWAAGLTDN